MKEVKLFEKVFKSVTAITETGNVLVSEGSRIKVVTLNEETGETNEIEGRVMKLSAKKMEIQPVDYAFVSIIEFEEIAEIEVL